MIKVILISMFLWVPVKHLNKSWRILKLYYCKMASSRVIIEIINVSWKLIEL